MNYNYKNKRIGIGKMLPDNMNRKYNN